MVLLLLLLQRLYVVGAAQAAVVLLLLLLMLFRPRREGEATDAAVIKIHPRPALPLRLRAARIDAVAAAAASTPT